METSSSEEPRPADDCAPFPVTNSDGFEVVPIQSEVPLGSDAIGLCSMNVETVVHTNNDVKETQANADNGLIIGKDLCTKRAVVKVERLSEISVDIWCNQVSNYYKLEPTRELLDVPVNVELSLVKGYGTTNRPAIDDKEVIVVKREKVTSPVETDEIDTLMLQAEKLVTKAKDLATVINPTKRKKSKKKTKKPSRTSSDSHVGTVMDALDALHQKTINKLTPIGAEP